MGVRTRPTSCREEIEQLIIEVLTEIQTMSGHPPPSIDSQTRPVGGLPGFDSMTAIEATVEIESRLDQELPDANPFVNEGKRRALRIHEVVDMILESLKSKAVKE